MTKLQIARYDVDQKGNKRNYPWYVEIQNGAGVAVRNANGGRYCKKDSYVCHRKVRMFLSDRDMFVMFCRRILISGCLRWNMLLGRIGSGILGICFIF